MDHLSMDEWIQVHDDDLLENSARTLGISWERTVLQKRRDWMETVTAADLLRRDVN